MSLAEIMTGSPLTVGPEDTLVTAEKIMTARGFRHLPVVDRGRLVGIISDLHLANYQARIGESIASNPNDKVRAAMHDHPLTATRKDSIKEVALRMAEKKLDCVAVTEDGALVGIVTRTDLLKYLGHRANGDGQLDLYVSDLMAINPPRARVGESASDALERMRARGVRHLPVVDEDDRVVGIVTEGDLRAVFHAEKHERPGSDRTTPTVGDAMSRPVITAWMNQTCAEVIRAFVNLAISAVPVVDKKSSKLIGMLSYVDVLRAILSG